MVFGKTKLSKKKKEVQCNPFFSSKNEAFQTLMQSATTDSSQDPFAINSTFQSSKDSYQPPTPNNSTLDSENSLKQGAKIAFF